MHLHTSTKKLTDLFTPHREKQACPFFFKLKLGIRGVSGPVYCPAATLPPFYLPCHWGCRKQRAKTQSVFISQPILACDHFILAH